MEKVRASLVTPITRTARARSGDAAPKPRGELSQAQARTEFLISALGTAQALAELLNVSRSQPSRWRTGAESPGPEAGRLLIDLDHVLARASMLWPTETARDWLTGSNAFLQGARPIDVLRERGSGEVIAALDAALAGSFA